MKDVNTLKQFFWHVNQKFTEQSMCFTFRATFLMASSRISFVYRMCVSTS
jgi:hypothetical protein